MELIIINDKQTIINDQDGENEALYLHATTHLRVHLVLDSQVKSLVLPTLVDIRAVGVFLYYAFVVNVEL